MLAQHLSHIDFLDEAIAQLDQQIQEQMRPFAAALATWDSLPGINQRLAEIIVAEIGADLEPFEMPSTWPLGRACVPVTTKAPANARVAARAKAVPGCGGP